MSKLAICFLVTKNIVNLPVWEKWWEKDRDKINIYAHFSQIGNITQDILIKNRVPPVPTKWGDISLVLAEGQLYHTALKNKDNVFFILVSDTCIPVRDFTYTYKRLLRDKKRGLVSYRDIGTFKNDLVPFKNEGACDKSLKRYKFYEKKVYASDQWKILSRRNAKSFLVMLKDDEAVSLFTTCIDLVPDSLAPDELMFINWMNKRKKGNLKNEFRNATSTFVDFKGKAIHPINFRQTTKNLAEDICYSNSMFARKFPQPLEKRLLKQTPVTCERRRVKSREK